MDNYNYQMCANTSDVPWNRDWKIVKTKIGLI